MSRASLLVWVVTCAGLGCGEDLPICPTGSCTLPGSTIVKWKFNNYPQYQFDSDACSDLSVVNVRVEVTLVGDPAVTDVMEKGCGEGQLTFVDLPLGTYTVAVTPLDIDGNPLVNAATPGQLPAAGPGDRSEVTVPIPYTAWTRPYTGQFLYRLAWGGPAVSCAAATPMAVAKQNLTLTAGGHVVTAVNDRGDKLDGTTDYACWALTEQFPQSVMNLPFGPATLLVVGKTSADVVVFRKQFETFIGAGAFNPTLTFEVTPGS